MVNNKKLLVLSSFVKSVSDKCVKAGTSQILILRHSKQVLSKVLKRLDKVRTIGIVLNNIAIIRSLFHIQIAIVRYGIV